MKSYNNVHIVYILSGCTNEITTITNGRKEYEETKNRLQQNGGYIVAEY